MKQHRSYGLQIKVYRPEDETSGQASVSQTSIKHQSKKGPSRAAGQLCARRSFAPARNIRFVDQVSITSVNSTIKSECGNTCFPLETAFKARVQDVTTHDDGAANNHEAQRRRDNEHRDLEMSRSSMGEVPKGGV